MNNEAIVMAIIAFIAYKIGIFIGKHGDLTIPQLIKRLTK